MNCRSCGSEHVEVIFSLGRMPLANALLDSPDQAYETFPLDLCVCSDCTLAQLKEVPPPEKMFANYTYMTSYSPELVKQAGELVARVKNDYRPKFVVEVGSNDGYLLKQYLGGVKVLGVDPSFEACYRAEKVGVPSLCSYFTEEIARGIVKVHGHADVVHANNVLAHVPDPGDFVRGIRRLLKPDGVAIIEVQYAKSLSFDQIYAEHACYFTVTSLHSLLRKNGLGIRKVEMLPTHGGSIRAFVGHGLAAEVVIVSGAEVDWKAWALRQEDVVIKVKGLLYEHGDNLTIGFGAAAKATVMMNRANITDECIRVVVDDSPLKQGKWIPGTDVQIVASDWMTKHEVSAIFIFAWNFADSIMARFPEFKGRFIVPLPEPEIR